MRMAGFTLIEVLVALAIIAIAMTAAIKAASTDIMGISHLQEKTMAMWVGEQAMNEARVGLIDMTSSEGVHRETRLLNRNWYWVLTQETTPNPRIREYIVTVYASKLDEEQDQSSARLNSYVFTGNQEESRK